MRQKVAKSFKNFYTIFIFLLMIIGCENNIEKNKTPAIVLRIDLQSQFEDDSVRVMVDDTVAFEGRVRTETMLDVAKVVKFYVDSGPHYIHVQVIYPDTIIENETTAFVYGRSTVAARLDRQGRRLHLTNHLGRIIYK